MSLGTYPMIAWGDADDLSASPWVNSGLVITGGIADPFGGTGAYSLQDDSAVAYEYVYKPVTFVSSGTQFFAGCFRYSPTDGATEALFRVYDNTANVDRGGITLSFSGSTLTAGVYAGSTGVQQVALGDSWYYVHAFASGVVAANTNIIQIHPAASAAAAGGTMRVYMRSMVLLDLVDNYRRFARPRAGYATVTGGSGVRDAWSQGTEYVRQMTARWVPSAARGTPAVVSGFHGPAESVGANASVEAMVLAGLNMGTMRWVPDRSASTVYQDCYLTEPGAGWAPTDEPNGDYTFPLELVASSAAGLVP